RYPDGPNQTKPGARADLLDQVNRGTVLFNYIGHGSPFKISDESVMIDSDADLLVNATRPSVFVAASCDVGKFNDPAVVGLGERLILNPKGGCVGVISATELASSRQNASLNLTLFQQLFRLDPTTGQFYQTLSQALLAAKGGSTNSQKYQLLGDAGTRLNVPRQFVEVALEDTNGNPVTAAARGQVIQVRGQVVNRPGGSLVALDGSASLLIEDDAPLDSIPDCTCPPYPYRAAPMFRGDWALSGGRFSGRFLVPMDAAKGPRGRVRAYVAGDDGDDGAGSSAVTVTAGAPPADDHAGPRITLSFPGGGRAVRPDAVLRVDLSDPSGILITGHTPRNGIVVTVDENLAERREITSSFHYAEDSYQSGTAFYPLGGLPAGPHRVRVSASDNLAVGIGAAQHRSEATLDFEVAENPPLRIMRAFLFPNPITSRGAGAGGNFIIDAPGDSVNTLVRIYTVAGRLVRTLERFGSLGQAQVPWDGRDDEGAPLANGVYLFQVLVNPRAADESSSGRQKAGAEGRFVVVNR
ncbi:MAG: hypothetical protein E6K78_04435, partial [Candidatus Eisenbacteria bacterium]